MDHKIPITNTIFESKFIFLSLWPFQNIQSSNSFWIKYNILLWNSLFNNETECRAPSLTTLFQATLKFPLGNSRLFAFLTNLNAIFPKEGLALMDKIKAARVSTFNSPFLIIFYWHPYHLWEHFHAQVV